jgi:hypothetical protein
MKAYKNAMFPSSVEAVTSHRTIARLRVSYLIITIPPENLTNSYVLVISNVFQGGVCYQWYFVTHIWIQSSALLAVVLKTFTQ